MICGFLLSRSVKEESIKQIVPVICQRGPFQVGRYTLQNQNVFMFLVTSSPCGHPARDSYTLNVHSGLPKGIYHSFPPI